MTEAMKAQEDKEMRAIGRFAAAIRGADIIGYTIEDQGFTGEVYAEVDGKKDLGGRFTGGGDDTGETNPAFSAFQAGVMRLTLYKGWLPTKTYIRDDKVCCSGYNSSGQWVSVTIEIVDKN